MASLVRRSYADRVVASLAFALVLTACSASGLPANQEAKPTKPIPGETSAPLTASSFERATIGCPGALEGHGARCPVLTKGEECYCVCAPDSGAHCEAR